MRFFPEPSPALARADRIARTARRFLLRGAISRALEPNNSWSYDERVQMAVREAFALAEAFEAEAERRRAAVAPSVEDALQPGRIVINDEGITIQAVTPKERGNR